ncbi:MAG TPA: DJ-1/PfpI family protein [Methanocorpusculum sp.]|nr:DJ-1/PfpI family protein [Methanocorpusculum sp.]
MKILLVIAADRFMDMEYSVPKKILEDAGHTIVTASTRKGDCYGMHGDIVQSDITLDEVNPADYDGIIIASGIGCQDELWTSERLVEITKVIGDTKKFAAAICLATVVLAEAGLLEGKKATGFPSPATKLGLARGKAEYVDKNVVTDGNIVTAKGPFDADPFAKAILSLL